MVSNLSHYVSLLDDFKASSTDSRLLILQDLETVLNGFQDVHAAIQFNLAFALYSSSSSENLVGYLLDLITATVKDETALGLGGALGAICRAGVHVKNMKKMLKCLREDAYANPPKIENRNKARCRSVLRALEVMAHPLVETPLSCFFNFSGPGSSLFMPPIAWSFQSAYQVLLWFRVEEFASSSSNNLNGGGSSSTNSSCAPSSIASFTTGEGIGIEYSLEDNSLYVVTVMPCTKGTGTISSKTVIAGNIPTLEINKWYSLVLQHYRPRNLYPSAISTDQIRLRVLLNREETFDGPVPLSNHVNISLVNARIGKDLQGQISGVFLDAYNDEDSVAFKRLESLKSCYSFSETLDTNRFRTVKKFEKGWRLCAITQSMEIWRKGKKKALAAYMPYHCEGVIIRELTSGWHATYGPNSCTWVAQHPRETISCIGGIGALLPLLGPSCNPLDQLLVYDNYSQGGGRHRQHSHTSGIICNNNWHPLAQVLLVLAAFLSGHDTNQSDFIRLNGLEWLEAAIASRPAYSFLNFIGASGDDMYEAKHLAVAVEHFCWSCAPIGSSAWKSSIIRLLGTMSIWGEAPSCFRTALLLSFESVTANVTYTTFQDGRLLPNTITFSLSPASLLETLALSCPPISSANDNCCDVASFRAERKTVLRILTPMVTSTPQNGVELVSRVLMCSATTLANDSIAFMDALLSLLHVILSNENLREEAMTKLIGTINKVAVQVYNNGEEDLTDKIEQLFALMCYLFRCCNTHTSGSENNNSSDKERLKATFIDVIGDCMMTPASFFEDEKMVHLIPYLRRVLLVPTPISNPVLLSSSSYIDNNGKLNTEELIDIRGPACEALASFTHVDSFVYEFRSSKWLSLMMESMLNTSLLVCSNTLLMMEQYFCGGIKEGTVRNEAATKSKMIPSSTDIASIHSSWLWQRHMVKIHVRLMMESSVKQQYETAFSSSLQIHAELLSDSISLHSNWGEEVELFLELVLQENEPCAKRAGILILIKLVEVINVRVSQNIFNNSSSHCIPSMSDAAGAWFWDNVPGVMNMSCILCEWCKSNGGGSLYIDDCLCLSTSILEIFDVGLLGNYLFQVSASTNGSYNWMGNKTKEEINVLTREMGMLAISLLKLSEIVLEGASIENNPMWVLRNGKRIASVCRQTAKVLSQCAADQEEKEESQQQHPICIAPLLLSLANSGLVHLYKSVMRMKESSNEDNGNNNHNNHLSCIDAALVLSDGLKCATNEAREMLERSVEAGECKVSEAVLQALRSALVESTTAPIPGSRDNGFTSNDNSDTSNWDTVCRSLEWVKCSRYFEPEISAELKSHSQDILNFFHIHEEEDPCSNTAVQYENLVKEKSFEQMRLCKRCKIEDEKLAKESAHAITAFEMESAIMKDGLEQLEQTMRVSTQCNQDLTLQVARKQWDGLMKNCIEEWSPWVPSGSVSYQLSCGEGSKMLQILLMPTNYNNAIDYTNTTYDADETVPLPSGISELDISVVKHFSPATSSSNVLNNNVDISYGEANDNEDITRIEKGEDANGDGIGSSATAPELMPLGSETDGWEEITVGIAQAAEWDAMTEAQLAVQLGEKDDSIAGQWQVFMLLPGRHIPGTLSLSQRNVLFRSSSAKYRDIDSSSSSNKRRASYASCPASDYQLHRWCLRHLQGILLRRYMLDERAVELFWVKADGWCSRDVFLAFDSVLKMQAFVSALKKLSYKGTFPLFAWPKSLRPAIVTRTSRLTEAWKRRQISNFDYLVCLNIVAGRSYNDMTQYPVMPWVLADYESPELDLSDSSTFRDLSKPVGALDERRLYAFRERCESFVDPVIPRFLYGSHYSSPGIVIHYLIRQEPYTSMHVKLQGDKFDCPDRLFFDVNQSWRNCLSSMSDVKELIPELFCCPDVLLNNRGLPLGTLQDGSGRVHDVRLPPWASGSPHKFIRLHRMALESEEVSCHLHKWIDLVFGYKQRGEAALRSDNLFYYLTYEGAVNVASITDSIQREAVEAQVAHFGQTPSQLFMDPHPSRLPPENCAPPCFSVPSRLQVFRPPRQPGGQGELGPVLSVCCSSSRVMVVHAKDLTVTLYSWTSLPDGEGLPFSLKLERSCPLPCAPFFVHSHFQVLQEIQNGGGSQPPMTSKFALVSSFMEGSSWMGITATPPVSSVNVIDCLVSCGYWDGCLKVYSLNTTGVGSSGWDCLSSSRGLHMGRITCLTSGQDGGECAVATGGEDMLVCVWQFSCGRMCAALAEDDRVRREMSAGPYTSPSATGRVTAQQQRFIGDLEMENNSLCCILRLYGHDSPITCLDICGDVGLIASGAADGRIALHTVRCGSYVRTLWLPGGQHSFYHHPSPHLLCLSQHGDLIVYSGDDSSLHLLTVNGTHVASVTTPGLVQSIVPTADGESIVCSHTVKGEVVSRSLLDLHVEHTVASGPGHDKPIGSPLVPIMDIDLSPRDGFLLIGLESGTYRLIAGALMPTTELEQSERQGKRLRSDSSHSWRAGFDENYPTPPPSPLNTGLRERENEEAVEGDDEEKGEDKLKVKECRSGRRENEKEGTLEDNGNDNNVDIIEHIGGDVKDFFAKLHQEESTKELVGTVHSKGKSSYHMSKTRKTAESEGWECYKCNKRNPKNFTQCDCGSAKRLTEWR